jgi:hypothetical protein
MMTSSRSVITLGFAERPRSLRKEISRFLAPAGMLGAPDDLQPAFMGAHAAIAERHNNTFLDDGRTPSRLVVSVVMMMVMMMVVVVVVVVEILRQSGVGFSLHRLGVVHLLEESERVGNGLEQLREGLGL